MEEVIQSKLIIKDKISLSGFILTTVTVLAGSLASVRILRSEEGRQLRARHEPMCTIPALPCSIPEWLWRPCPLTIIPVHLGDPALCSALSNVLLQRYGHSVRAIKLPTVLRGQEKFMLAHTPHYFQ